MAINLFARYGPGQADAPIPGSWDYGRPRDVSVPGAGDGTPWELAILEDIMGWQQALLIASGITPTDIPENTGASQYLAAITTICGRQLTNTTAILVTSLPEITGVNTLGYYASGDGGEASWVATGGPAGPPGTTDLPNGLVYDLDGREFAIAEVEINPRHLGARGDGVSNDQPALQAAGDLQFSRGGGVVRLTSGTYFCNSQMTHRDKVSWWGDSGGASVVTFAGAAGAFPDTACFYGSGSSAAIPDLNADAPPGVEQIVFAAVHTLAENDLFYISDPRASSYGGAAAGNRAGEFCVVANVVDTTTVDVRQPLYATTSVAVNGQPNTYLAAQVDVKKVTPIHVSMRDMTIVGVSDVSANAVISVDFGRACAFERLELSNSNSAAVAVSQTFDLRVRDVTLAPSTNEFHPIRLAFCQQVMISGLRGGGAAATIFITQVSAHSDGVVNREIYISDCDLVTQGGVSGGVTARQNCEHINIANCHMSGVALAGDRHRVRGCDFRARSGNPCIQFDHLTGSDVQISDCRMTTTTAFSTAMVVWDQTGLVMDRGGTLRIADTTLDVGGFGGDVILMVARDTTIEPSLEFISMRIKGRNVAGDEVQIASAANAGWKSVLFSGCNFEDVDLECYGMETLSIDGLYSIGGPSDAILVTEPPTSPFSERFVNITNCQIFEAHDAGIKITDRFVAVRCIGTTSLRNDQGGTGTDLESSFVFDPNAIGGTTRLLLNANVFGDDHPTPTQSFAYAYGPTNGVSEVLDLRTSIIGSALPVTRNGLVVDVNALTWDDSGDQVTSSSPMGVRGGDPATAPTGADEFAVGSTGSNGMYIKSGTSSVSSLMMGDSSDADRFRLQGNNANNEFAFTINSAISATFAKTAFFPGASLARDLGLVNVRWRDIFGGRLRGSRLLFDFATAVVSGDFTLSAGWGTTPVVVVAGRDPIVELLITADATTGANPIFTYTYPDGTTPNSGTPRCMLTAFGSTNSAGQWQTVSTSTTAAVVRFIGTPIATQTYGVQLLLVWAEG